DGFPGPAAPWIVRKTIGAAALRLMLISRRIPRGMPLPRAYRPREGLDAHSEAQAFRAAVERFASSHEPLAMHPLVGRCSRERWERYHCIHCAHHLSFAIPRS